MKKNKLTRRLTAAFTLVREGRTVADIGTDHAYLPIALVSEGKCKKAFASDIGKGPLERAKENITSAGLDGVVDTVLTDGAAYFDGIAEVQRDFDSSILTKLGIKELYRYGIRFSEDDAYKVVKYLVKSEGNAPIIRSYTNLGWSEYGDVKIFRGQHAFCADGIYKELTYNGKLNLKPTGDLNK